MRNYRVISTAVIVILALLLSLCACNGQIEPSVPSAAVSSLSSETTVSTPPEEQPGDVSTSEAPGSLAGEIVIIFNYEKQSGSASNQFAVWIEELDGRLLKTLFATRFTADGGYEYRPDSIPVWVQKSGLASMAQSDVDAIAGATPNAGEVAYTWDLTGMDGAVIPSGEYRFCVEGTLRWKNQVIYSGVIELGNEPATVQADAEFIYEGAGEQPALTDDSPEHGMISGVRAAYTPAKAP